MPPPVAVHPPVEMPPPVADPPPPVPSGVMGEHETAKTTAADRIPERMGAEDSHESAETVHASSPSAPPATSTFSTQAAPTLVGAGVARTVQLRSGGGHARRRPPGESRPAARGETSAGDDDDLHDLRRPLASEAGRIHTVARAETLPDALAARTLGAGAGFSTGPRFAAWRSDAAPARASFWPRVRCLWSSSDRPALASGNRRDFCRKAPRVFWVRSLRLRQASRCELSFTR
jgi:hypothetical protein